MGLGGECLSRRRSSEIMWRAYTATSWLRQESKFGRGLTEARDPTDTEMLPNITLTLFFYRLFRFRMPLAIFPECGRLRISVSVSVIR